MNKAQWNLIPFDSQSAGLAQVCLAVIKTDSNPRGSVTIEEKPSALISTAVH